MTNVPNPIFTPTGFSVPEEIDVYNGAMADVNAAFGGNLNVDPSTPQGQWITSLAAVIGYCNDLFLYFTNQIDPSFADGQMQDAIARIYAISRLGPRPTAVAATVTGAPGTVIPAGSLAQAQDGTIYETTGAVTITIGGTATANFQSTVDGPITLAPNTLNRIYRLVPGWESVNNTDAGIPGRNTETRADLEDRRLASVAGNAVGILPAIRGAVLAVPDVLDAYVRENPTGSPVTVQGVTLPAHSLYVAVVGGTDAAVARAIWSKKNPGCDYYPGNTTVTVQDTDGYAIPYPSYTVKFERPADLGIAVKVRIASSTGVPSNALDLVRAAVLAAFNGEDGGDRAKIGATLFASRFYAGVASLGAWAKIVEILIGTTTANADTVSVDIDQIPTLVAGDIAIELV